MRTLGIFLFSFQAYGVDFLVHFPYLQVGSFLERHQSYLITSPDAVRRVYYVPPVGRRQALVGTRDVGEREMSVYRLSDDMTLLNHEPEKVSVASFRKMAGYDEEIVMLHFAMEVDNLDHLMQPMSLAVGAPLVVVSDSNYGLVVPMGSFQTVRYNSVRDLRALKVVSVYPSPIIALYDSQFQTGSVGYLDGLTNPAAFLQDMLLDMQAHGAQGPISMVIAGGLSSACLKKLEPMYEKCAQVRLVYADHIWMDLETGVISRFKPDDSLFTTISATQVP